MEEVWLQQIRGKKGIIGSLPWGRHQPLASISCPAWLTQSSSIMARFEFEYHHQQYRRNHRWCTGKEDRPGINRRAVPASRLAVRNAFLKTKLSASLLPGTRSPIGKPLALSSLNHQLWIFREQGSGTRDISNCPETARSCPVQLKIDLELSSSEAIKAVVATGHGLTFLSRFVVARELASRTSSDSASAEFDVRRNLHFVYPGGPAPWGGRCFCESCSARSPAKLRPARYFRR